MAQKAPKIKITGDDVVKTEVPWRIAIPDHVEAAIKDALTGLEHFVPDEKLRRLLISEPDNRKVAKLGQDPEVAWILGYLRGITDLLKLEPSAVWQWA